MKFRRVKGKEKSKREVRSRYNDWRMVCDKTKTARTQQAWVDKRKKANGDIET
jgi:hypothetical protein